MIYDGNCGFCISQVERIRRLDVLGQFELLPSQTPDLLERFPQLAGHDLDSALRLVAPDGRVFVGAEAVYEIAKRLPRFRAVAWVYRLPLVRPIAERIYAWVARRRYQLSRCQSGSQCRR